MNRTVKALRETGRIEPVDDALTTLCKVAARLVDEAVRDPEESRFVQKGCIAEARATILALKDQTRPDVDNLSLDDMFAAYGDIADRVASD